MFDMQKGLQKAHLILPDVLTLRDAAVRKIEMVMNAPMPGGSEELALKNQKEKNSTIRSHLPTLRDTNRSYENIRKDIVQTAKEQISKRLNIENEWTVEIIKKLVTANTLESLVKHSVDALKSFFMDDDEFDHETNLRNREQTQKLVSDIREQWPVLKAVPTLDTTDVGCQYSVRLRQMFQKSTGQFKFLLGALLVSTPHNMGTERVVSHFNRAVSIHRRATSIETESRRLAISINSPGTATFDPRPAVVKFLTRKERRFHPADLELYKNCPFVNKFFRTETMV